MAAGFVSTDHFPERRLQERACGNERVGCPVVPMTNQGGLVDPEGDGSSTSRLTGHGAL